ncbi:MAG: ATP-binding protein [Chloroflexota bacterium]
MNLVEVITETLQDLSLRAIEKNLTITTDIADNIPPIIADRQKFDLILINLFDNAMKFTASGGKICFKATFQDDYIIMSIQDSGIGIPSDHLEQIFDRFYQVEPSLTREYGGIGLGLAIVRGMVEVCGGKIYAESELDVGSTFTFTLPLDNTNLKARKLQL